jgi:hypothetical protein
MKTITVRLASEEDAALLRSILQSTRFRDVVETTEEDEDVLTDEDLSVLNDRLELYRSNPSTGKGLEEVNQILRKKYGL